MILRTKVTLNNETLFFDLDTNKLDKNCEDECYAYWIVKDKFGYFHEINVWKDEDFSFTNKGKDYIYYNEELFEEAMDANVEISLQFTFLDPGNDNLEKSHFA